MAGGYSISITAVDKTTGTLDGLNKRLAALNAPAERFSKAMARFGDVSGLARVSEGVRGLGKSAADAFVGLDQVGSRMASITSVASIAGMVALERRWAEFGNSTKNLAYRLNTPVEKLGSLRVAMQLAGGSAVDADSGLQGLNDALRAATFKGEGVPLFNSLGIKFRDAAGGARNATDALGDVADAIQRLHDPRTQGDALDRLGLHGFLPLFQNGRRGLEAFQKQAAQTGAVPTGGMIENASKLDLAWVRVEKDLEGVWNKMADDYAGPATKMLSWTSKLIESNQGLAKSVGEISFALGALGGSKLLAALLRRAGLGTMVPGVPLTPLLLPLGLSGDTPSDPLLNQPAATPGFFGQGGTFEKWVRHPFGGSDSPAPPPIIAPSGPTNSAAAMRRMHDYFRAKGLDDQQTAGILSNAAAESGFDASKWGDGGTSYGLFQTHADRLAKMQQRYGTSTPNEQQQLDFAWDELNTSKKSTLERIQRVHTSGQSGAIFSEGFEVPAGGQGEAFRRGQAAPQFEMQDGAPGKLTPDGSVHVEVTLKGATAGTTAKSTASGSATTAPPRIETPMPLVN